MPSDAAPLYARLEERILARDQIGASATLYDLLRAGEGQNSIIAEAVRIHAPYTHVPYHERIDDGYVNFVNNDHCLLSARATINLARLVGEDSAMLPLAQTIWYIPTGLDIWNQKIGRAPGHYTRGFKGSIENPPPPVVYWPDQQPLALSGALQARLETWLTHVHRGQVPEAYRIFLGLMQNPEERKPVLAELVFAGLIDVQDRLLHNRSFTTGHKAYRARATVEIGSALGWENAHDVLYAGALDIAVGPRWYSTYEMACNAVKQFIEGEALHAVPYRGVSAAEQAMLGNTGALSAGEAAGLADAILRGTEPDFIAALVGLLKAGKSPRRILDAIQLAAAEAVLSTHGAPNFSGPHHCYEYCNTLGWFFDRFDHPRRLRLLFVAAAFLQRVADHQRGIGDFTALRIAAPDAALGLSAEDILARTDAAICALAAEESVAWTQAYLDTGADRARLVRCLALAACKLGNDPHNQEIAQCMLMDYATNQSPDREILLLACAWHTALHRKYGDPLEAARRFGEAMGIAALSGAHMAPVRPV